MVKEVEMNKRDMVLYLFLAILAVIAAVWFVRSGSSVPVVTPPTTITIQRPTTRDVQNGACNGQGSDVGGKPFTGDCVNAMRSIYGCAPPLDSASAQGQADYYTSNNLSSLDAFRDQLSYSFLPDATHRQICYGN